LHAEGLSVVTLPERALQGSDCTFRTGTHRFCFLARLSSPKVKPELSMHNLTKNKDKEWVVAPKRPCAFTVVQLETAKKEKPSDQNGGSYVKLAHLEGNTKIMLCFRWKYTDKKHVIEPLRPGLFLKTAMRVKAGTFIPLAGFSAAV
jgi:hypothetical protein